jgi:Mechanosensitive ion channel
MLKTILALILLLAASPSMAADAAAPATTPTAASTAPAGSVASPAAPASVSVLTGDQVVQILDATVDWYRTLGTQQQNATQPSDLLILYANRQTADQVVGLAFEIARANAELLSSDAANSETANDSASPQALSQQQAALEAQRQSLLAEIAADKQALGQSNKKAEINARLTELQGELAMLDARKNLLDTMADFVGQRDPKGAGANALKAHIDAIAATVPTGAVEPGVGTPAGTAAQPKGASPATAAPVLATDAAGERHGIWDLGSNALKLHNKMATITAVDARTAALADTFEKISAQPLKQLMDYSAQSEALAARADHADSPTLKSLRDHFDTLAWLFKQTSGIMLPLSKEKVLLQQYRHNLANWRDATERQYHDALAALGVRLAILAVVLAAVFGLAEVWRRTVVRYVHEPRRRYQLLLVRRFVVWAVVIGIIGFSVVSEISTFATFAGLLTAGIAVAMQSVLVSVVGYFFLIGKYGIRVGDRIQIGTVVGEVIELGLVRLHLMELNTQGPLGPTGRVVGFANLIVFQASGGLFKQIPGVTLEWHETSVTLPAATSYAPLKAKLLSGVDAVVAKHRDELTSQNREIARSTASGPIKDATPQVHMQLVDGHMKATVRYPVHLSDASDMDEDVAEMVLKVLEETRAAAPQA